MKNFLVLFREPDGRTDQHTHEDIDRHQFNWNSWFEKFGGKGYLAGGSGLSLNGCMINDQESDTIHDIYRNGTEIVGGYILLRAIDLDEAAEIIRSCPIFEFGGTAEIREIE
jgi:hypothetical protein